jgi:hypothetical protein
LLRKAIKLYLEQAKRVGGNNLVSVVLFGSVARGDFSPDESDLDFLVVFERLPDSPEGQVRLSQRISRPVQEALGCLKSGGPHITFSEILKTRIRAAYHTPLYLDMVEDAKILYDKGGFFKGVLDLIRARMRELGSVRKWLPDGRWYWDLKPDYKFGEVFEI